MKSFVRKHSSKGPSEKDRQNAPLLEKYNNNQEGREQSLENVPLQGYESTSRRGRLSSCPSASTRSETVDTNVVFKPNSSSRKEPEWKKTAREQSRDWSFLNEQDYKFEPLQKWDNSNEGGTSLFMQSIVLLMLPVLLPSPLFIGIACLYYYCQRRRRMLKKHGSALYIFLLALLSVFKDLIVISVVFICLLPFPVSAAVLGYSSVICMVLITLVYWPSIYYNFAGASYGFEEPGSSTGKKREKKPGQADKKEEDKIVLEQLLMSMKSVDNVAAEMGMYFSTNKLVNAALCVVVAVSATVIALVFIQNDLEFTPTSWNTSAVTNGHGQNFTVSDDRIAKSSMLFLGFKSFSGVAAAIATGFMLAMTLFTFRWRISLVRCWHHINCIESGAETAVSASGIRGLITWFQAAQVLYFFSWSPMALTGIYRLSLYFLLVGGLVAGLILIVTLDTVVPYAVLLLYIDAMVLLLVMVLVVTDILLQLQERKARQNLRRQMVNKSLELAMISMDNDTEYYEYQTHLRRCRQKNLRTDLELTGAVIALLDEKNFGAGLVLTTVGAALSCFVFASTLIAVGLKENDYT